METALSDHFSAHASGLTSPLSAGFEITPNDSADLSNATRQIRITGQGGNIAVVWLGGGETIEPVSAGETLDWRIKRIKATGTTATGLRGYF
jgi:hypothetical protein